jgi:hypothetical protein
MHRRCERNAVAFVYQLQNIIPGQVIKGVDRHIVIRPYTGTVIYFVFANTVQSLVPQPASFISGSDDWATTPNVTSEAVPGRVSSNVDYGGVTAMVSTKVIVDLSFYDFALNGT